MTNSIPAEAPTVQKFGEDFNLRTPQNTAGTLQKFGDKRDVAELLGLCTRSIDNLLAKNLPHIRLSKRCIRFDLDEVRAWAKREYGTRRNGPENGGQAQ